MLDARLMQALSAVTVDENTVEARILEAALRGDTNVSVSLIDLSADAIARLHDDGYTVTDDVFTAGNVLVWWW